MEYYDIDDILLQESKVKVEFKHRIHNFGFLISHTHKTIPENRKVDTPYFLISFLLRNGHCKLSEELLDDVLLNDIRAKASIVDLRTVYPYFFYLCSEILDEKKLLTEFFYERLSDYCAFLLKETLSEDDVWRLDMTEKRLISNSRRKFQDFRRFFVNTH